MLLYNPRKNDLEPLGILVGMLCNIAQKIFPRDPLESICFFWVWFYRTLVCTPKRMVELVLPQAFVEFYLIGELQNLLKLAIKSHFFFESSSRGFFGSFA